MCHVELMRKIFCIFREFTGEERGNDDGAPKFKIGITYGPVTSTYPLSDSIEPPAPRGRAPGLPRLTRAS